MPRNLRHSASKYLRHSAAALLTLGLAVIPGCTADTASAPAGAAPKAPATQTAPPTSAPAKADPVPDAPTQIVFDAIKMTIKGRIVQHGGRGHSQTPTERTG